MQSIEPARIISDKTFCTQTVNSFHLGHTQSKSGSLLLVGYLRTALLPLSLYRTGGMGHEVSERN